MQTLLKFNTFITEITAEAGRNYKISVLEKYKDDTDIKYYLTFLFNPYITTGISNKLLKRFHVDSCIDTYPANQFNNTFEALDYLKMHNTGDYNTLDLMFSYYMLLYLKDIKSAANCLEQTTAHQLFEKVIGKDLQIGIDSKTINKVIPGLIPEFNVMLANKYFDNPKIVEGKDFALTTKIDGGRIIAIKENGEVSFYTRQGQKYEGLVELETEMREYMPDGVALDGELTLLNRQHLSSSEQYKATMKESRKDGEKHGLKMLVFDAMKAEQFRAQKCDTPYYKRRKFLESLFANTNQDCYSCAAAGRHAFIYFELLPILYRGNDITMIEKILHKQVENNEEGIIINLINAPYEFKRSNVLLKCKLFNDLDLECIGFEEGTNSNKGRLGALLLKYNDNIVKCGSGFSEDLRSEIWQHQDKWLGRTITVKYFEESYDSKTGLKSLRFPIYVDWRSDKATDK